MKKQEPDKIAIADRILELVREGETDTAFADRVDLTPGTVSNYRKRQNGAGLKAVWKVVMHDPRADARYILTGRRSGEPSIRERRYDEIERVVGGKVDDRLGGGFGDTLDDLAGGG